MDQQHTDVHGRHRRRRAHRRAVALGVALLLVAGAVVGSIFWLRDTASSEGTTAASSSPNTSGTGHEGHPRTTTSSAAASSTTTVVSASAATPKLGAAIRVGKAPHLMALAPGGRFAYIADPELSAIIRFDAVRDVAIRTIPIPEAPPQLVTFSHDVNRANF
jgi:serine/threonine-protein kinase